MSEITNIKQSILSDITGQEYINRRNFLESPIMWWENEQTQLNATNLNKMSRAIKNVQDEFSTESNNVQSILADVVSNIAGWSSTENNTAEIFNDYQNNKAIADYSSAKGTYTIAGKVYQHSDGHTETSGKASSVEGIGTVSTSDYQHVQGRWNILDEQTDGAKVIAGNKYAHIVGNGTSEDDRSNAHTVSWEGDGWFARHLTADGNAIFGTDSANRHLFNGKTWFKDSIKVQNNLGVYGDTKLDKKLNVKGAVQLNSTLSVAGLTNLNGNLNVVTDANISGKTTSKDLNVTNNTVIDGTLTSNAVTTFNNNVTFTGSDKEVVIQNKLTVDGESHLTEVHSNETTTHLLTVTGLSSLANTEIGGDLGVVGNISVTKTVTASEDVKAGEVSLVDEHNHLDYLNLIVREQEEQTVPNAIKFSEDKLIGRGTLTADFPTEMEEVKLENETIYGAAQYSINLVKSLLNAYILDNDEDDPEARTAIDKLIEIADWISKDDAGVTKILSDIELLSTNKLNTSVFNTFVDKDFTPISERVTEGATNWDTAFTQSHIHSNSAALDSITSDLISNWTTAYNQRHTHNNKTILNGITEERVSKWDASAVLLEGVSQDAIDGIIADGARITENTNRLDQQDIIISSMQQNIESIEEDVNSTNAAVNALVSRITTLESIINTLISSGTADPTLAGNDPGTTYFIRYE